MSEKRQDNPRLIKTGSSDKKKGIAEGKKTDSTHLITESQEMKVCASKGMVTQQLPLKSSVNEEHQDCSKNIAEPMYINPDELERKCWISEESVISCTKESTQGATIITDTQETSEKEVEKREQFKNPQEFKNLKYQTKGPHYSSTKGSEKKLLKRLEINKYTNFMKDFDPEKSQREARKLENLPFPEKKEKKKTNDNRLYDENGVYIETGEDLCDCLIEDCPGCHFPCHKCRSCKCGHVCRRNRTWCYDEIEIEGTGVIIKRKK